MNPTRWARIAALALPFALLAACAKEISINSPANNAAVDPTFSVDVTWTAQVSDVHVQIDGADVTSKLTLDPTARNAKGTLALAAGPHKMHAEGKLTSGAPVADDVTFQVGGFTIAVQPLGLIALTQGKSTVATIVVSRAADAQDAVAVSANGLPPGVTMTPTTVPAGATSATVTFAAAATAPTGNTPAQVSGTSTVNGAPMTANAPITVGVGAATTGPAPTWSTIYSKYFAGNTASATPGHCMECHGTAPAKTLFDPGNDKHSFYAALVAKGLVDTASPSTSKLGDSSSSPLSWINPAGKMPKDAATANTAAHDDILAWLAAGALDN